jgi:hypothetical protein
MNLIWLTKLFPIAISDYLNHALGATSMMDDFKGRPEGMPGLNNDLKPKKKKENKPRLSKAK